MDRMSRTAKVVSIMLATTPALAGCLFPNLDELSTADVELSDAGATTEDACPNTNDPTLEAYYRLDEGAGAVAKDCSTYKRDGVMVGVAAETLREQDLRIGRRRGEETDVQFAGEFAVAFVAGA